MAHKLLEPSSAQPIWRCCARRTSGGAAPGGALPVAEEDEAAARRRGRPARDRRLRCGRRRLDGDRDGAGDGPRRARGGRRAGGRGEEEARGRGAGAGEQRGKRSWSSHLPVAIGWIDLAADMGLLGGRKDRSGQVLRGCCSPFFYKPLVHSID